MKGKSRLVRKADSNPDVELRDFKVKYFLGQGGYGRVFLASLDCQEDKMFAIKTIRKDRLVESTSRKALSAIHIEF